MKTLCTRISLIVIIAVIGTVSAGADATVRMAPVLAADFAVRPTWDEVGSIFDDRSKLFWGPQIEVITNRVGVGFRGLVNFENQETELDGVQYDWSLDWLGDLYVSYHIFGTHSFIDPFFEFGFGNAGRVDIDEDPESWMVDEESWMPAGGLYEYNDDALESLALYPSVAVGVSFDLGGLFIGARLSYRPLTFQIPATQFDVYPVTNFQFALFGGITLGD